MVKEFQQIGDIGETRALSVVTKGNGLALYLPRVLVEIYGLRPGDQVKASLLDHYRPKIETMEVKGT